MMMGRRKVFTYFQCNICRCLQIEKFPKDISTYYASTYYAHQKEKPDHWIKKWLKLKRNNYAIFNRSLLGKMIYKRYPNINLRALSHLNLTKEMPILDVGSGRGQTLHCLYQLGFRNLTGVDPFNVERILKIGKHVNIFRKTIHKIKGKWTLIMMHHSFEHMPDPLDVLKSSSKRLLPGGHCLIRIPVVCSKAWQEFRVDWVQLDPPRHYFLHSPKSMRYLIDKTDLQLQQIIYDSTAFQFWGSIQYKNNIPLQHKNSYSVNPQKSMFTRREVREFSKCAKRLNLLRKGDQAIFILQKPG